MRFALIGAGAIAQAHARLLDTLPGVAQLSAVVDVDIDRARALAHPRGVPAYASIDALLEAGGVDAVSICLPSNLHAGIAEQALRHGLHVLVEKPIDISLEEADRLIAFEGVSDQTVGVVSQRRFQPPARAIKDAIDAGRLGRLTSAVAQSPFFREQDYFDSSTWRGTIAGDGGGALMNQGIHALDLLLWFLGRPVEVSAFAATIAHEQIEVEDVLAANILFESGAVGTVLATTAAYPGLPVRVTVHGDAGTAIMDDDRLVLFSARDGGASGEASESVPAELEDWHPTELAHRAQYIDFVDAVRAGRPPAIGTAEGRAALAVVLAIYESARTGKNVPILGGASRG